MASQNIHKIFNKKAGTGLAAALTMALSGCAVPLIGETPLPLTEGEKTLSHNIFGKDNIDTDIVRKYLSQKDDPCAEAVTYSDKDTLFYKKHHSLDYSNKEKPRQLALFVHEMTHIWQKQNWSLFKQFEKHCNSYSYKLTPDSKFDDFCNEQQAAMLQEYARYFLSADPIYPSRLINNDDPQALAYLKNIIETTFPDIVTEKERTEEQYPDVLKARQNIIHYRQENNIKTVSRNICS